MEARTCDRCGRFFDKTERYQTIRVFSTEMKEKNGDCLDLCHDCMKKLVSWLENGMER